MAFFWFFAGIISVAAGLCYIKRGVAQDSKPHAKSSACSSVCSGTCTCTCGPESGEYPNADEGIDTTLKACDSTCTCTCDHTGKGDSAPDAGRPDASR